MQCLANRGNYRGSSISAPPNLDLDKSCSYLSGNFSLNFSESKCDTIRCQMGNAHANVPEFLDMFPCNPSDNHLSNSETKAVNRNNMNNMALCKKKNYSSTYTAYDRHSCILTCSIGKTYTYNGNVADGTLIKTENTLDMCLNGDLIPIGCDDEFFSTAKRDNCGICNGDNSRCVYFEEKKSIRLTRDWTNITNLYEGTTSLVFKLTLEYYQGVNGPASSIALIRYGRSYQGNSINVLTDITYEIKKEYEIISSEKLASPLTIQIVKNFMGYDFEVNYKLKYGTLR
ncbi:unnamed protein product [Gordionus sp. m RMFG-2023]